MSTTRSSRLAGGALAAGLLLLPLTGCSEDAQDTTAAGVTSAAESAAAAATSAAESASEAAESASAAASSAASAVNERVDCSGDSCSVTVSTGSDVEVLGLQLSLQSVEGDQATVTAGDSTVTCGDGETVSVGPLSLQCSDITDDSVTLSASLG
ncbi:hypothetical protein [Blastococcus sp. SYSU DS0617]